VTNRLRRKIEFFKREAKKQHVHYQKMIEVLLDLDTEWVGKQQIKPSQPCCKIAT